MLGMDFFYFFYFLKQISLTYCGSKMWTAVPKERKSHITIHHPAILRIQEANHLHSPYGDITQRTAYPLKLILKRSRGICKDIAF
jgi:hypothetical protein